MTTPKTSKPTTTHSQGHPHQPMTVAELVAHAAMVAKLTPGTSVEVRPPDRAPIGGYRLVEAVFNSWESLLVAPSGRRVTAPTRWVHPVEAAQ